MSKKVQVVADEEISNAFPEKQSAIVTITTSTGVYSERVDFPKGEPENPMSCDGFYSRYMALMSYGGVDQAVASWIYASVNNRDPLLTDLIAEL